MTSQHRSSGSLALAPSPGGAQQEGAEGAPGPSTAESLMWELIVLMTDPAALWHLGALTHNSFLVTAVFPNRSNELPPAEHLLR